MDNVAELWPIPSADGRPVPGMGRINRLMMIIYTYMKVKSDELIKVMEQKLSVLSVMNKRHLSATYLNYVVTLPELLTIKFLQTLYLKINILVQ